MEQFILMKAVVGTVVAAVGVGYKPFAPFRWSVILMGVALMIDSWGLMLGHPDGVFLVDEILVLVAVLTFGYKGKQMRRQRTEL